MASINTFNVVDWTGTADYDCVECGYSVGDSVGDVKCYTMGGSIVLSTTKCSVAW